MATLPSGSEAVAETVSTAPSLALLPSVGALSATTGGLLTVPLVTVTDWLLLLVAPLLSVTVNVTV